MVAWDFFQYPVGSTIFRVWMWQRGGALLRVPVSNFFGRGGALLRVVHSEQYFASHSTDWAFGDLGSKRSPMESERHHRRLRFGLNLRHGRIRPDGMDQTP